MPSLLGLPSEILLEVAEYLSLVPLLQYRLVSQRCNDVIAPSVLKNVRMDLFSHSDWHNSDRAGIEHLTSIIEIIPHICRFTRHLTITTTPSQFRQVFLVNHLMGIISTALHQMRSIKSLKLVWKTRTPGDNREIEAFGLIQDWQDMIIGSILTATNNKLTSLNLFLSHTRNDLPQSLLRVRGLRKFVFQTGELHTVPQAVIQTLSQTLHANSNIETVRAYFHHTTNPIPASLLLETLSGGLLHLDISFISFPAIPGESQNLRGLLSGLQGLIIRSPISQISMEPLWLQLSTFSTRLVSLTTYQLTRSLVDYLASYTGLEEIDVREVDVSEFGFSVSPSLLLDIGLAPHLPTLRKLFLPALLPYHSQYDWEYYSHERLFPILTRIPNLHSFGVCPFYPPSRRICTTEDLLPYCQAILSDVQHLRSLQYLEMRFNFHFHWDPIEIRDARPDPPPGVVAAVSSLKAKSGRPARLALGFPGYEYYAVRVGGAATPLWQYIPDPDEWGMSDNELELLYW